MTTTFGKGVVIMEVQLCAKIHCPSSTVTLHFERRGPQFVHRKPKKSGVNRVKSLQLLKATDSNKKTTFQY